MRDPEIQVPRLAGVPGGRGTVRISAPYLGRHRRGSGNETVIYGALVHYVA